MLHILARLADFNHIDYNPDLIILFFFFFFKLVI